MLNTRWTVVSVGYPASTVGTGAIGGAEQIMSALDAALIQQGHRSIVIAPEGSRVAGELAPTRLECGLLDREAITRSQERHSAALQAVLSRTRPDLIHMHGVDFDRYLPDADVPVLVTLHGPREWYSAQALRPRSNVWQHCVSDEQHRSFAPHPHLLDPIENGVSAPSLPSTAKRGNYALVLSRVAPEKGIHLALDAAHRADIDLIIAGAFFEYPAHRHYFHNAIAPRLDRRRRYIGPVEGDAKWRLLAEARCLLLPAQVPETSSLVAREAAAAGTPVIAFPAGALRNTVEHGRTGFHVHSAAEMADAVQMVSAIDPDECRRVASARFSAARMIAAYFGLYRRFATVRSPAEVA